MTDKGKRWFEFPASPDDYGGILDQLRASSYWRVLKGLLESYQKGRRRFQQRPINHDGSEEDAYADVGGSHWPEEHIQARVRTVCAVTHI